MAHIARFGRRADLSVSAVIMAVIALLVLAGIILGPVQGVMKYWQKQKETIGPRNADLPEEAQAPWKVGDMIAFEENGVVRTGRIDRIEATKEAGWIFAGPLFKHARNGWNMESQWWRLSGVELNANKVRAVENVPDTTHGDPPTGRGFCGNGVLDPGEVCDTAGQDQLYLRRFEKQFFGGTNALKIQVFDEQNKRADGTPDRTTIVQYSLTKICTLIATSDCGEKQELSFAKGVCASDCTKYRPMITCTDTDISLTNDGSSRWLGPEFSDDGFGELMIKWQMQWSGSTQAGACSAKGTSPITLAESEVKE